MKTKRFNPANDVPDTKETQATLDAIKKAAQDRGITQAQLVRRGLILAAPELKQVFMDDML